MIKIKTLNHISPACKEILPADKYQLGDNIENPDAIFVRATKMHDYPFNPELLCVARAGIGINNIPLDVCTKKGICVFNTPGGNANGVKELFLFALAMCGREIIDSMRWVYTYDDPEVPMEVKMEKVKNQFAGPEYQGKTLGVIGTGNVGSLVANIAYELDMKVIAYDPYLSVDAAWKVSRNIERVSDVTRIFRESDYITVHVPLKDDTFNMINAEAIAQMRDGVNIINYARGEIVNEDAIVAALESGKVHRFVCDFPTKRLAETKNAVLTPHLGGTTLESEEKCAVMAAREMIEYIANGNIKNSVNLPDVTLERAGVARLCVIHANVPRMINRCLDLIGDKNINVEHMINKPLGSVAYTVIDVDQPISDEIRSTIANMSDVYRVRVI
ncbi:MAG: 3-phosphoglycerate dehydrogenase family protein [Oscillospiraceae bacterium]|nr:3-phosphoglycerate dehydrogenase family protein [Oscillospiraceae bacterium]